MMVRANENLFERWRELGSRIGNLASIVQNDIETTPGQMLEWLGHVDFSIDALMALRDATLCYCFPISAESKDDRAESTRIQWYLSKMEKPTEVIVEED